MNLDNLTAIHLRDPEHMLERIAELPDECEKAWKAVQKLNLPDRYRQARRIIIVGMGGSAIGGALLSTLVADECPVPIFVNRDYTVPAWVDGDTLVIASSYSGNTEETLTAFEAALARGAMPLGLTTGGKLGLRFQELDAPVHYFSYKAAPRAALGHSLIPLLGFLCKLGFIADKSAQVEEAVTVMRSWQVEIKETVPMAYNRAKQLATRLHGRLPVVYGAGYLSEVARRWKGQFNENSKNWSFFEQLPELNHNAVVGYEHPADLRKQMVVVMLRSSLDHPRNQIRFQVTQEILEQQGVSCEVVEARGKSPLAQVLSTIHFGDYVSFYLAMLNEADPTPVETISYLKKRLAEYR